jgi:hypothetical protein
VAGAVVRELPEPELLMVTKSGVLIRKGQQPLDELYTSLAILADIEVLVGFPEETAQRQEDSRETDDYGKPIKSVEGSDMTNAALGYVHDNGAPEVNIPARPFMIPGIEEAKPRLVNKLAQMTNAVVRRGGGMTVVEQGFHQVGLIAKLSIQNKITEGIPPPLADSTLRERAKKGRKGAGIELLSREKGYAPSMDFAKPLVDTGQMRNAVTYVIRSRKKRSK